LSLFFSTIPCFPQFSILFHNSMTLPQFHVAPITLHSLPQYPFFPIILYALPTIPYPFQDSLFHLQYFAFSVFPHSPIQFSIIS
jgi:hypothetical protein